MSGKKFIPNYAVSEMAFYPTGLGEELLPEEFRLTPENEEKLKRGEAMIQEGPGYVMASTSVRSFSYQGLHMTDPGCPVCKQPEVYRDEHGPLINHLDTCMFISQHPESEARKELARLAAGGKPK